jgi:ribosomal protein S18 acetylase RimI-like enzyme
VNQQDLIAASDVNYFESWRSFAQPAGFVHEDGGVLIAAPSRVLPWMNVVFVTRPLADPVAELRRAFDLLDDRKLRFFVHLRDGHDPAAERACEQLGFVAENAVPGMVLDPIVSRPNASSLDIRPVRDGATFDHFINVSAESFGIPLDDARLMFPTSALHRPNVHYWVGYAEGRPAACSHLLVLDHIASINIIGTLEAYRGRGFGAAITQAAVNGGAEAGCRIAVLQASELGQPVYERMGFRTVASYKTYLRP